MGIIGSLSLMSAYSSLIFDDNFAILQLSEESADVALHIELNLVDKELHDVLMDKREYVEVMHLHGYTTILWRDNARKALSQRQVSIWLSTYFRYVVKCLLLLFWHSLSQSAHPWR